MPCYNSITYFNDCRYLILIYLINIFILLYIDILILYFNLNNLLLKLNH